MTRNKRRPGRILLISDLHVMSLWGLMPDRFEVQETKTDHTYRYILNKTQRGLLNRWKTMEEYLVEYPPDVVIINGDLAEGRQLKSQGKLVVSPDLAQQEDATEALLERLPPLKGGVPTYITVGSEYHSNEDRPMEESIAARLKKSGYDVTYGDDLIIKELGLTIYAKHFIPVSASTWQYRTTPVARDLMLLTLNNSPEEYGDVDVLVNSHAHYSCVVQLGSQTGVITPCWQGRNKYAVKRGICSTPDIGYMVLVVDGDGDITIKTRKWKWPRPARVVGRDV